MPKIKNIIIFTAIAATFVLIYIFFIRPSPEEENLVVSPSTTILPDIGGSSTSSQVVAPLVAKDFLALLLNVKNIKLDDAILSDPAFLTLRDSSIVLIPDGNEGRPNPFAKFGNDAVTMPTTPTSPVSPTTVPPTTPPNTIPDPVQP